MTTSIYSISDTQSQLQVDGVPVVTINKVGGITKESVDKMPVLGTAVPTTSGITVPFTGIPTWAKKITVMFSDVSLSGTSNMLVQIGSGSLDTSGYSSQSVLFPAGSTSSGYNPTSGFGLISSNAANAFSGHAVLTHLGSNIWVFSATLSSPVLSFSTVSSAGRKQLSGVLDRLSIITANGSDTFDTGAINILYE